MSQHTELIARLLKLLAEVEYYPEEYAAIADAIDALQALERQKQPDDLEQIIDAFVEDYEMVGEDEDGRDACHTPTEGERALIKDAICGLLADPDWDNAWGDLIRYQAQQRTEERVPMTDAEVVDELPELDPAKPTTEQGVYRKFNVTRVHPSEKHKNCEYFVLDVDHDEYAPAALAAYAKACRATHPDLSDDIMNRYFASPQAAQTEAPLRAMDFHELKNHVFPISGKPR